MPRRLYPAIVHTDDGETFGVSFVDFPVHAGGNSVEAAVADARHRWGAARDAGHEVVYWRQTRDGQWQRAGD